MSPPLRFSTEEDLQWWSNDGRPVIALVPEHDDYLKPEEATKRFSALKQIAIIPVRITLKTLLAKANAAAQ